MEALNIDEISSHLDEQREKNAKNSREWFKKYYSTETGKAKTLLRYYAKKNDPVISALLNLDVPPVEKYHLIMLHKQFKRNT